MTWSDSLGPAVRRRTVSWRGLGVGLLLAGSCTTAAPRREPVTVRLSGYEAVTAGGLAAAGWKTDLSRLDVPLSSILTAGIERDAFDPLTSSGTWPAREARLGDTEPVIVARFAGGIRAWPVVELLRKELLLDEIDGIPVAVTYCSLCATARVWDRRVASDTLDLAVSGMLLDGNSLLFDRQTESLWRQIDGRAVVGTRSGARLTEIPSWIVSLGELRGARPDAPVMRPAGPAPDPPIELLRAEDIARGTSPEWLAVSCPAPLEMRLDVIGEGDTGVSGESTVENRGSVVIFRDPACALPFRDPTGRASPVTGSAFAFRRACLGRDLTFEPTPGGIRDVETGSQWNLLGEAVEGPLEGRQLQPAQQLQGFRFAVEATHRARR